MFPAASSRLTSLILADGVAGAVGWSLVVIVCVIGGFYVIAWLRRWLKDEPETVSVGFTLGDLRDLHRRGEMTDEEYEKAKAKIVSGTQAEAEKIKPAGPPARDSVEAIRARSALRRGIGEIAPPDTPPSDKPRQ